MNRKLSLEFVRVTEAAAINCARLLGKGDKIMADQLAVNAMRAAFDTVEISGRVVIGEGEMDEAPMLYIGEEVGSGGYKVDIAVDPLEGTTLVAKGQPGAIAVMAIGEANGLLHAPDMYMDKICVGPRAKGCIDINDAPSENLKKIAVALERKIEDLTIVILDRERHAEIIKECRSVGARIKLISDGDVAPAIEVGLEGTGVHMVLGVGGAPEGVLAAAALKCLGGDMQARLIPFNQEERDRCMQMGIKDFNQVLTIDDMVKGEDTFFCATAVSDTGTLSGVRYFGGGARTNSIVMRYKTGTIRFVDTIHHFDKKEPFSVRVNK